MPRKLTGSRELPQELVATSAALQPCLEHLAASTVIAFDTEFVGEETYRPDLCLVQVATTERMYLIDPLSTGPLDEFWNLLADPKRTSIVHAGREEVRMCHHGIGRPLGNMFDVQIASGLVGYTFPIGYSNLVNELLGVRLNKGETLTDWRRRPLTAAQVDYAFDDVRYLIPMWRMLQDRLHKLSREDWAYEEFQTFLIRSISDDPATEKWRKIKGIGGLGRRGLAVAREVYFWRDDRAARGNRPSRTVLRDELVAEIARNGPNSIDEVQSFRGVAKVDAPGIFEAVRHAKSLPMHECPEVEEREFDPPHVALLSSLLVVVLGEWCARNSIAANQVATTQDLKRLVRERQPGVSAAIDSNLRTGWRQRVVLPELQAFLDGRRSLTVENPASDHPIRVVETGHT